MTTKIESNRLFTVYFGENKLLTVTQIEAKNATEAIEQAKSRTGTKLDCTAVESSAIYAAPIGIECDDWNDGDENGVFEIVVRGANAEKVERMKKAIALAIGGIGVTELDHGDGKSDGGSALKMVIAKNGISVVGL